eukprot:1157394-Pelagomonas_calceolata.AAC.4
MGVFTDTDSAAHIASTGGCVQVDPGQRRRALTPTPTLLFMHTFHSHSCTLYTQVGVYSEALGDTVVRWVLSQRSPKGAQGLACFSNRQICTLLWALAKWRHDAWPVFEQAGQVLVARSSGGGGSGSSSSPNQQHTSQHPPQQQQQQQQKEDGSAGEGGVLSGGPPSQPPLSMLAASPGSTLSTLASMQAAGMEHMKGARALTPRDLHKLLWAWAKFNRHPGPELLEVCVSAAWVGWRMWI